MPRFYLKRFSPDIEKTHLRLFLVDKERFVQVASIDGQASKNFYYGADGIIEDRLSTLEGELATLLRSIDRYSMPERETSEFAFILGFVALTDFRNPVRAQQIEEGSELMGESTRMLYDRMTDENIKESEKFLEGARKRVQENKVSEALRSVGPSAQIISDLQLKLIVNESERPFITSDYPIIHYNQYFEHHSNKHVSFGLGTKGVQIFVPIDPKQMLMFYDNDIYYVGADNSKFVVTKNTKDVDQLNILQYLNCMNAAYGDDAFDEKYANQILTKSKKYYRRRSIRTTFLEAGDGEGNHAIGHAFNLRSEMRLSFCSLRIDAARAKFDNRKIYVRPAAEFYRSVLRKTDESDLKELLKLFKEIKSREQE